MGQSAFAAPALLFLFAFPAVQPQPAAPPPVQFRHVNVVDVRTGTVRPDQDVTIRDGRIAAVTPAAVRAARGVRAIDASGKFLIPGLADMHVHWYDERYVGLFVASGVTTVRQMWGSPLHLGWRGRIDAGQLLGPRFSIASGIVNGPNPIWPRERKATQSDAYDFSELELNDAGYMLMRQKKIAEAIALLELNVEMYPRSANVYDSLGEAHAAAGHRDLAIANYRKSLALDPRNQNAIEQLKKLGGG